jgi:hypothetical protein
MAMLREPDAAPAAGGGTARLLIPDQSLCVTCNVNPRHAGGRLSRCLPCIRSRAEEDRRDRIAAEAALAARRAELTKACRSCGKTKALGDFARHARGKDGRRAHCRACVSAGKVKRNKPLSPEGQARDRERRRSPEYLAQNLAASHAWQTRNKVAVEARRAVTKAVKAGTLTPAKTCQILGCRKRSGLVGHHNSYTPRNHTRVVWVCRAHHQSVHSGVRFRTKAAAAYRTAFAPETA